MGQTSTKVNEPVKSEEKKENLTPYRPKRRNNMSSYEKLQGQAFRRLRDDKTTQGRLQELSRRGEVGIEAGQEELERTQRQGEISSSVVANQRAAAAATGGITGATTASKLLGAEMKGLGETAAFEADLAARDYAAQQAALEKKGKLEADITQHDIGQAKSELQYETSRSDFESNIRNNIVNTFFKEHGRAPTEPEMLFRMAAMNID